MRDGKADGYWKTYYKNGKVKIEGNRRQFLLDSIWRFYDEKGRITKSIRYNEGKKDGLTISFDTLGYFTSTEFYKKDVKDGPQKTFYSKSKTKTVTIFVNGKAEGQALEFSADSLIIGISTYKGGILQGYEKINQKDELNRKQGIWKEFYENMELKKNASI